MRWSNIEWSISTTGALKGRVNEKLVLFAAWNDGHVSVQAWKDLKITPAIPLQPLPHRKYLTDYLAPIIQMMRMLEDT